MSEHDYAADGRDDLLAAVTSRELQVEGTGANGYVTKDDLVAALWAADQDGAGNDEAEHDYAADGRAIERQTKTTWWCPVCDHSQTKLIDKCTNCGAERDGDRLVPSDDEAAA